MCYGLGEASGPLYPPPVIDEEMFSCEEAVRSAYDGANLGVGVRIYCII